MEAHLKRSLSSQRLRCSPFPLPGRRCSWIPPRSRPSTGRRPRSGARNKSGSAIAPRRPTRKRCCRATARRSSTSAWTPWPPSSRRRGLRIVGRGSDGGTQTSAAAPGGFQTAINQFTEALVSCARRSSSIRGTDWCCTPWGSPSFISGASKTRWRHSSKPTASARRRCRAGPGRSAPDGPASCSDATRKRCPGWSVRSPSRRHQGGAYLLVSAVHQFSGRPEQAKTFVKKALELRPGSTAENAPPPFKNASPIFVDAVQRIVQANVAAGLPEH